MEKIWRTNKETSKFNEKACREIRAVQTKYVKRDNETRSKILALNNILAKSKEKFKKDRESICRDHKVSAKYIDVILYGGKSFKSEEETEDLINSLHSTRGQGCSFTAEL